MAGLPALRTTGAALRDAVAAVVPFREETPFE
jgi:hypothetical protein